MVHYSYYYVKRLRIRASELIGSLGDVHLYKNHLEQGIHEQIRRDSYNLPKIKLSNIHILEGEFDYEILIMNHTQQLKHH